MPWRWASVVIAATSDAGKSAYSLIAVAPVPFARATASLKSVSAVIACIQGAFPGSIPRDASCVRGSAKNDGPANKAA